MKIRPIYLLTLILASPEILLSQEVIRMSGQIVTQETQPLAYASTLLVSKTDSVSTYGGSADKNGRFIITAPRGDYHFEAAYLGYEKYTCDLHLERDTTINAIPLQPAAVNVEGITVKGQNIHYNSNGYTLQIGNNALYKGFDLNEVLGMSPGISARDGGISIYGKGISKVYLNERELKLSGAALTDYLKGINGESIQKIEVVTSSGVEDDAQAMGGRVLKITTKPLKNNGGILTASSTVQYRNGAPSFTIPRINVDIKQGKFSTYLRTNYRNAQEKNTFTSTSNFYNSDKSRDIQAKQYTKSPLGISATWGMGYDFNSKNLLSVEASYSKRKSNLHNSSQTIERLKDILSEEIGGDIRTRLGNEGVNVSANYIHLMKNDGKLLLKADWTHSTAFEDATQDYRYRIAMTDKQSISNTDFLRNIYTLGADYSKMFRDKRDKFIAGVKFSHFSSHNEVLYQNLIGGSWIDDPNYTDDYLYRETVSAAYAKYVFGFKKFSLGLGVRLEQTEMDPESQIYPERNHRSSYTDLFPEISANYDINKKKGHMLSLHYQRSLKRPSFTALNPYIRPAGPFSYFIGNPYLKPEYKNSLELNTVLFNKYVLVLSYNNGKGTMRDVVFKKDDSDILYTQQQNLGAYDEAMAYVVIPIQLLKWWKFEASGGYMYQSVKYADEHLTNNSVALSGTSTMRLPGKFNLIVMGSWYNRMLDGNAYVNKPFVLDAKLNKTLCKNQLALAIGVSDILNAEGRMPITAYGNGFVQRSQKNGTFINYSFTASYTFKWGKQSRIRQVEAGNKEERARE